MDGGRKRPTTAPLRGYDGVRQMASLRLKKKRNS
jgi:hypothetical protein